MSRGWILVLLCVIGCGGDGDGEDEGMSEAVFGASFDEQYCDQLAACGSDLDCEANDVFTEGCDYDPDAAADCLDGTWGCDANDLPTLPSACVRVHTPCET